MGLARCLHLCSLSIAVGLAPPAVIPQIYTPLRRGPSPSGSVASQLPGLGGAPTVSSAARSDPRLSSGHVVKLPGSVDGIISNPKLLDQSGSQSLAAVPVESDKAGMRVAALDASDSSDLSPVESRTRSFLAIFLPVAFAAAFAISYRWRPARPTDASAERVPSDQLQMTIFDNRAGNATIPSATKFAVAAVAGESKEKVSASLADDANVDHAKLSSVRQPTGNLVQNVWGSETPSFPVGVAPSGTCSVSFVEQSGVLALGSGPAPLHRTRGGARSPQVKCSASLRDSEGNKIKDPRDFDAADPSQVVSTHTAQFKKRPFGVLSYAPSLGSGNGAMVWKMNEKSRYPGDPQGQAWVGGVRTGYAIKTVGGTDVSRWNFWDIMDLVDDKILDNSAGKFQKLEQGPMGNTAAELPLTIEYAVFKEVESASSAPAADSSSYIDRNDPRYRDLPPDATLVEYKIPPLPANYRSQVVEDLRTYVRSLPEPVGYAGPRYRGLGSIDKTFIDTMIANFKVGQLLPMKDAYNMAIDVFDILVKGKSLGRLNVPEGKKVTVVGDLHGQLYDFSHMLSLTGYPSPENPFVFNGDFVDRGPWSVEVIFSLLAFKLMHPEHVCMNRGNHESEMANTFYGFFGEVEAKYEKRMCDLFAEIFRATPLAHVINNEVFVVHGGIPGPDPRVWWKGMDNQVGFSGRTIDITLEEIENCNRFMEPNPSENPLMVDLLWSDPKGKIGYGPSGRMSEGIYLFGPDVSEAFMRKNNLKMCLRSHEVKAQGYRYDHEGQYPVITVFSAPNYVDKAGNRAAVAVLTSRGGSLQGPEFIQYDAQPHPDVPSGSYAAGGPLHPDTVAAR